MSVCMSVREHVCIYDIYIVHIFTCVHVLIGYR